MSLKLLKETPWLSDSHEHETKGKDASEVAHMRIMEWAKELQEASEVSRGSLTRQLTSNVFYFYVIYVLVGVTLFKVNGGKSQAFVCVAALWRSER